MFLLKQTLTVWKLMLIKNSFSFFLKCQCSELSASYSAVADCNQLNCPPLTHLWCGTDVSPEGHSRSSHFYWFKCGHVDILYLTMLLNPTHWTRRKEKAFPYRWLAAFHLRNKLPSHSPLHLWTETATGQWGCWSRVKDDILLMHHRLWLCSELCIMTTVKMMACRQWVYVCACGHLLFEADCPQHVAWDGKHLSLISVQTEKVKNIASDCLIIMSTCASGIRVSSHFASTCVHEYLQIFGIFWAAAKMICVQLSIDNWRLVCSMETAQQDSIAVLRIRHIGAWVCMCCSRMLA